MTDRSREWAVWTHYKQVDGVAMGSQLGPLFANIFLSFHEKSWLPDCPSSFKPCFIVVLLTIVFWSFNPVTITVLPLLSYLNSKHSNIQFTHEFENNSSLPFLDVKVMRSKGSFTTSVPHKFTSTGLFTNYDSFIPMMYTICTKKVIFSVISPYFNICSSCISFRSQIRNIITCIFQGKTMNI